MKLAALAPVVVTLATALITGCGSGLTTRANTSWSATQAQMDAELSHDLIGTTELTSAALPLPTLRTSLEPWSSAAVEPPTQTWGADPELDPSFNPEYGF